MMNYGYQQTIQYGGYMNVRSRDEAFNYPVALGTMMIFAKNDGESIFTKVMGFSQYDKPFFSEYNRVKEDDPKQTVTENNPTDFMKEIREQINAILSEIKTIKKDLYEEGGEA